MNNVWVLGLLAIFQKSPFPRFVYTIIRHVQCANLLKEIHKYKEPLQEIVHTYFFGRLRLKYTVTQTEN